MKDKTPNDSLSIEWGRFKAGAIGRFAIAILAIIVVIVVAANVLRLWQASSMFSSYFADDQTSVGRVQ